MKSMKISKPYYNSTNRNVWRTKALNALFVTYNLFIKRPYDRGTVYMRKMAINTVGEEFIRTFQRLWHK